MVFVQPGVVAVTGELDLELQLGGPHREVADLASRLLEAQRKARRAYRLRRGPGYPDEGATYLYNVGARDNRAAGAPIEVS
jgi:hypothetical protein